MWLIRGWKLDEIEDKSSSIEKLNSYKTPKIGSVNTQKIFPDYGKALTAHSLG